MYVANHKKENAQSQKTRPDPIIRRMPKVKKQDLIPTCYLHLKRKSQDQVKIISKKQDLTPILTNIDAKQMSLQSRAGDPEDHRRPYLFLLSFHQVL